MTTQHPTITALEAFNVRLCADTGAGKGHDTTREASAAYEVQLAARAAEARRLIADCRAADIRHPFVDGMEAALERALMAHPPLPSFPAFSSYVCEGDSVSIDHAGFTFTARIVRDDSPDRPDERDDGFWPSLDPKAAGFIGSNDRAEFDRQQARAEAIMAAFDNDDWFYCGVVITASRNEVELDRHAASLWGIEANYPESPSNPNPNSYLQEVANDLLPEALGEAQKVLKALCDCGGGDDDDPPPSTPTPPSLDNLDTIADMAEPYGFALEGGGAVPPFLSHDTKGGRSITIGSDGPLANADPAQPLFLVGGTRADGDFLESVGNAHPDPLPLAEALEKGREAALAMEREEAEAVEFLRRQLFENEVVGGGAEVLSRYIGKGEDSWQILATAIGDGQSMPSGVDFCLGVYPPDWDGRENFEVTSEDGKSLPDALREVYDHVRVLSGIDPNAMLDPKGQNWSTQFPDMDPATFPAIPEGWEDLSWHNDTAPRFIAFRPKPGSEEGAVCVWVDHLDPAKRELLGTDRRFLVHEQDEDGNPPQGGFTMETDDWGEVLASVRAFAMNGDRTADPLDSVGEAIRSGFTIATIGKMAARFAANLAEELTGPQWAEMRQMNAAETDPMVCRSHDFCDANMPMAEAFESVIGREVDPNEDADTRIWGAAWAVASAQFLTA